MGCGGSKFNAAGEVLPARLGPLFRRRIEDITRRRHANLKDVTPSKKELLLVDGGEEDSNSNSNSNSNSQSLDENLRKNVPSPKNISTPTQAEVDKTSKYGYGLEKELGNTKEKEKYEEREENAIHNIETKENTEDEGKEEEREEEDDEGLLSNDEGELIFPGSPSFRVYFIDNLEDDDKSESKDEGSTNKSQIGNDASPKDTVTKKAKKGRKRRSFRKVLPKGGKNLLNVRSCYISACTSHDHARLLTDKAHA